MSRICRKSQLCMYLNTKFNLVYLRFDSRRLIMFSSHIRNSSNGFKQYGLLQNNKKKIKNTTLCSIDAASNEFAKKKQINLTPAICSSDKHSTHTNAHQNSAEHK